MTQKDALDMINNYEANLAELIAERHEAWEAKNRPLYDDLSHGIRSINDRINALCDAYHIRRTCVWNEERKAYDSTYEEVEA